MLESDMGCESEDQGVYKIVIQGYRNQAVWNNYYKEQDQVGWKLIVGFGPHGWGDARAHWMLYWPEHWIRTDSRWTNQHCWTNWCSARVMGHPLSMTRQILEGWKGWNEQLECVQVLLWGRLGDGIEGPWAKWWSNVELLGLVSIATGCYRCNIMDNCAIHHSMHCTLCGNSKSIPLVVSMLNISSRVCIVYLSPYSPDFNPLKLLFIGPSSAEWSWVLTTVTLRTRVLCSIYCTTCSIWSHQWGQGVDGHSDTCALISKVL